MSVRRLLCAVLPVGLAISLPAASGLEWKQAEGFRVAPLPVPSSGKPGFTLMGPAATGITFTNFLSEETALENTRLADGAGVAAGDVDGDGWCDLYFCCLEGPNKLYRNLGNWTFEDITASAGVACAGQHSTGAVFADVDGDGDLDLLVTSLGGGTRLFLNDGQGRFHEALDSGLVRRFGAMSMALADLDGNGTLDLYVCNYATTKIEDRPNARFDSKMVGGKIVITAIDGVPTTTPELTNRYFVDKDRTVRERGEPHIFYRNDGHGHFTPVPWTDGTFLDESGQPLKLPFYDFGLSVRMRDLNGDGFPDIYVCNDLFPPDRIWINDGHGHFRPMSTLAVRHTCRFAMGMDFADINRDGHDDYLQVDMFSRRLDWRKVQTAGLMPMFLAPGSTGERPQYMRNVLALNRGDGTFADIAHLSGLEATEWCWQPAFLDVDLDGYEDVLVVCGYHRDSLNADAVKTILGLRAGRKLTDAEHRALKKQYFPVLKLPTLAFRNRADLTFEERSHEWGFDFVGISQGLCLADLDNDGDLDVIVNRMRDAAGVYRNDAIAPRVAVRLRGQPSNTRGVGARIELLGGPVPQSQVIEAGGRYLSCDDAMRTFAAGSTPQGLVIKVTWPSGSVSVVSNALANHAYEIEETGASAKPPPPARDAVAPLFQDVSQLLQHRHEEMAFNDFERQPLLARKLSQLGPGVSWVDVDGDGWDDLVIGSGLGGRPALFRNDRQGGFVPWPAPPLDRAVDRDQTTILGWRKPSGQTVLLAGSSTWEDADARAPSVIEYDIVQQTNRTAAPGWEVSAGPLAMADVDGDGALDLFVGGRVKPVGYPAPVASLLFHNEGGQFKLDEANSRALAEVGMVSGAVFSDLDGDGWPDLILACEWGPLKVFHNDHGALRDATHKLGLDRYKGWWNGVAVGDFDGDGRLDIVASNWGRNTQYQRRLAQPIRIYYGEWRFPGVMDQVEACYDDVLNKVVPMCSYAVARSLAFVPERFPTQAAFSTATVDELLGEKTNVTRHLEANWLDTTLFLNRGDHFEPHPLPIEAQFSPAFGVSVGDMDGDGCEDIFLSQNFFAVDGDTPRYDAGRGLWLKGDGRGGFRAVPGQESGVAVYGEQRGCALCDYDGDGRVDLVVTQNAGETRLYHNARARPGLRVRLAGPPGNAAAIGAVLRLGDGARLGPAREIHAGSGYWSQDSSVQVMTAPFDAHQLQVRWPGGKVTTSQLPKGAREVVVDTAGQVKVLR